MAHSKQLNIDISTISSLEPKRTKPHFDSVNHEFAEEHYGSYLLYQLPKDASESHSRIYLDLKLGSKFRKHLIHIKKVVGKQKSGIRNIRPGKIYLLDNYPEFKSFIKDAIPKIIPENCSKSTVEGYLWGASIFLEAMRLMEYSLNKLSDITMQHQLATWNNLDNINHSKTNKAHLGSFFGRIAILIDDFSAKKRQTARELQSIMGLPTTTLVQIDYYCRQEIERIKKSVLRFRKWENELEKIGDIFSIENLAKTYYQSIDNGIKEQRETVRSLAWHLYGKELRSFKYTKLRKGGKREFTYENEQQKKDHTEWINLSRKGLNITIRDERMFSFWFLTIIKDLKQSLEIKKEYKNVLTVSALRSIGNKIGLHIEEFQHQIYPSFHEIYPLLLFILVREGLNLEVIRSWKVHKIKDGTYRLGDDAGVATIIQGIKNRSNDVIWTPIKRDSILEQYIEFYLDWLTSIYEITGTKHFFQFRPTGNKSKFDYFRNRNIFRAAQEKENWFFKRYKITMPNGDRVETIDHRQPRVNKQFDDYLKDLDEFERQKKRNHKNIDTQIHYDNMDERKVVKRHKMAKALDLAEGIFKGKVKANNNHKAIIFEGPFADCKDPKSPDYPGYQKLREDEVCSDWFMCLCMCSKSIVDPKIHGPAIYAWREYMEEEKTRLLDEHWEKEYGLQYAGAVEVIDTVIPEIYKSYCEENMSKFREFVRMHFKRKRKIIIKDISC